MGLVQDLEKLNVHRCKMENNRKGCINRDKNGYRNMETGERPEKYRREYKFQ